MEYLNGWVSNVAKYAELLFNGEIVFSVQFEIHISFDMSSP